MIPLVLLDLDGTIIGADGQVAACVWQAVEKAQQAGVKLAACTGRPAAGVAKKVALRLGPRNPHVFQSGALISYPDGDTLHVAALKEAVALRLVEQARELGISLELYTPTAVYVERKTALSEAHAKMIGVTAIVSDLQGVARGEPVVRAQWVVPHEQRQLVERLPIEGVELSTATSPAMPDAAFVSVTRQGVSKGSAVRMLAESMKVGLENVMAVGDSDGDVPMLEAVGHPLVMANAAAELRERFPALPEDVHSCGAVAALERALALRPA